MEKNSNIFKVNREFSAYRQTDAVNNHKGVDLYIKLFAYFQNILKLNIAKKCQPNLKYLWKQKRQFQLLDFEMITWFFD